MKIALIGYGKMGKAIEAIAKEKGHAIVLKIQQHNKEELTVEHLQHADVAIECTSPESAVAHLKICFDAGVPVVCGSTGWLQHWNEVINYCQDKNGSLLFASNFSIGVNLFFELNQVLAEMMASHSEYNVQMEEIHHTQKKDAPSGTAISIAKDILSRRTDLKEWVSGAAANSHQLGIVSQRMDPAPGTHLVQYVSEIDTIEIKHTAHNRKGFASGAVLAAEFLKGKQGVYAMKDVLRIL